MRNLLLVLLILISASPSAQTVFRGIILDAQSKAPIYNAKVGITHQGVGVVSDSLGAFYYKKYHEALSDTDELIVSAQGYETINLDVKDLRALLNKSSTIVLNRATVQEKPKIKTVKIFWDVSEGMQERQVDKELAFIKNFLQSFETPRVIVEIFNNGIIDTDVWQKWDGDMDRFRESVTNQTYDAPSNYNVLNFEDADAVLLVSNGKPNYGKFNALQDIPVYAYTTVFSNDGAEYLSSLTDYTSGRFFSSSNDFSQTSIATDDQMPSTDVQNFTQKISGYVYSLDKPLQGATIVVKGDLKEYRTDTNGAFEVDAASGDVLLIRALGMFPKAVLIQVKKKYDINLLPSSTMLDEVVLTAQREKIFVGNKIIEGTNEPFMPGGVTSLGDFYITDKDIKPDGQSLERVLRKYFKGVVISYTPEGEVVTIFGETPLWVLNGANVRAGEPIPLYIPDNEILSVIIKDNPQQTNIKYGGEGDRGIQVLVTTKSFRKDYDNSEVRVSGNNYTEDVKDISTFEKVISGKVTSSNNTLQGAEVVRKGTLDIVYTQADGSFELQAENGDIIVISHLGMFTKEVLITDESIYNIDLLPSSDLLNEVVLEGEGESSLKKTTSQEIFNYGPEIASGRYKLPGFGSFDVMTVSSENLNFQSYPDLRTALFGRFKSLYIDQTNGRPYILRGSEQEYISLFIDGQLDLGSVDRIPPHVISSISIKSNRVGVIGPALILDTNLGEARSKTESALVKGNDYTEEVKNAPTVSSEISGTILSPKGPLKGATVTKKGTFNEVVTNIDGRFEIKANLGDIIVISTPAMFTKEVLIENTDIGKIVLMPRSNDLDEVILEGVERVDNTVETSYGETSENQIGYAVDEINTKNYSAGYVSLDQLIRGKVSGVTVTSGLLTGQVNTYKIRGGSQSITNEKPPIWIVNGTPYQDPPEFLDVNQIENISVLKSVMATSRYGSLAAGGAFIIKTKEMNFEAEAVKNNQSALVSGNEYTGDVTSTIAEALPEYINRFRESGTLKEQFALYKKLSRTQESPLEYYVDAAQYFQNLDPSLGDKVRSDLAYIARNNTKALRTLSYLYEIVNDTENVVLINERIVKIAPNEAQSYRDLALAYQNNEHYDKALELYINILGEQILGVNFDGLEKPLRSELSRLIALHKDKIDYSRLPNEWLRSDYKVDVRMTIDWSDRSVPFEFQFVNPQKKFFKWTHTLEETRERLKAEQKQGFQTEEFIIDDAPSGEWLINVQYLGNEGDYVLPPFLKYTIYSDYGTPKETKEVRVIKLFKQVEKVTLGRVSM